jgi:hypothetical protein
MRVFKSLVAVSIAAVSIPGCGESHAPLVLAPEYALRSVDGRPLPFVTDSARFPDINRDYRIVGRSVKILSADSADYSEAEDIVEPLGDGSSRVWASTCFRLRIGYVARRSFVVLAIDTNFFLPFGGPPGIRYDTLTAIGDTLVVHERLDTDRVLRLAFVPGGTPTPVCPGP